MNTKVNDAKENLDSAREALEQAEANQREVSTRLEIYDFDNFVAILKGEKEMPIEAAEAGDRTIAAAHNLSAAVRAFEIANVEAKAAIMDKTDPRYIKSRPRD